MCHFCLALSWLIFSPGDKRDGPFHCCEISAQKRTPHANANYSLLLLFLAMMPLFWVLSFWNVLLEPSQVGIHHFFCVLWIRLLCVDHVVWTGLHMLKLASNFEIFNYFFVFCWIEKKDELLCNFCNDITQPFLDLEGAPKCISQQH